MQKLQRLSPLFILRASTLEADGPRLMFARRIRHFSSHVNTGKEVNDRGIFTAPYLENVFPGPYVCDVDPLAVDIVAVGVPAAYGDTLLSHVVAGVAFM